jgi:hypothetical protein
MLRIGFVLVLLGILLSSFMPTGVLSPTAVQASGDWPSYDEDQSFFPITRYNIGSHSSVPGWEEFDASAAGVPAGATGIVLHVVNDTGSNYAIGARSKGDTWATTENFYQHTQTWVYCGVDSNLKFEVYRSGSVSFPYYYIEWYTNSNVQYLDPALNSFTTDASDTGWHYYDLSSMVSSAATGAILYHSTNDQWGVKRGTDSISVYSSQNTYFSWFLAPLDENQNACIQSSGLARTVYVAGYIETGVYWPDPEPLIVPTVDGSYHDILDLENSVGVILNMEKESNLAYSVRGSGDTGAYYEDNTEWTFACVAAGTGGLIEGKFESGYNSTVSVVAYLVDGSEGGFAESQCVNESTIGTQDGYAKCHRRGYIADTYEYVNDTTPNFSAIYYDDFYEQAYYYRIIVGDDPDLSTPGNVVWDSGKTSMTHTDEGGRCPDITYGGSTLSVGETYYWAIKFWDQYDNEGIWTEQLEHVYASFTVITGVDYYTLNDTDPWLYALNYNNSVARDQTGRVYVGTVWGDWAEYESTTEAFRIYYSDTDGESWDENDYLVPLQEGDLFDGSYTVEDCRRISLTVDSDDHIHCLLSFDSPGGYWRLGYMEYDGASWGSDYLMDYDIGYGSPYVNLQVAMDSSDDICCAWIEPDYTMTKDENILYFKKKVGAGWLTTVAVAGYGVNGCSECNGFDEMAMVADGTDIYIVGSAGTVTGAGFESEVPSLWYSTDAGLNFLQCQLIQPEQFDGTGSCDVRLIYEPENDDLIVVWERVQDILGTDFLNASYTRMSLEAFFQELPNSYLRNTGAVYATVQSGSTADLKSSSVSYIGQKENGGTYTIWRSAFWLDASYIPTGGTITSAEFHFSQQDGYIDNAWDLVLVRGDDLSPASGLQDGDYGDLWDETTALNSTYTVKSGDQGWETVTFNATGITYLTNSLGGWIKLGLRSSNDISASAPTAGTSEYLWMDTNTIYEPYIVMTIDFGGGDIREYYTRALTDCIHEDPDFMQSQTSSGDGDIGLSRDQDGVVHFFFGRQLDDISYSTGMYYREYDASTGTWQNADWMDKEYNVSPIILNQNYPQSPVQMMIAEEGFVFTRSGTLYWGDGGALPDPPESPTAPTNLTVQGVVDNPAVSDFTPPMSSQYNDPDPGDYADYYQIEVGTDTDWGTAEMWDSGKTLLTTPCPEGTQCENIDYAGSALSFSSTYYWRMKFWDQGGYEGAWSATGNFTTVDYTSGTPTVTTYAATDYTGTTAILHGHCQDSGGADPVQSRFQYDVDSGAPYAYSTSWSSTFNPPDTFQETIPIIAGQTYYFIAQARNDDGNIGSGSELSFTAGLGNPSITTQPATSITISTARLNSYLNSDGGEDCYVRFQYGTTEEGYGQDDDADSEIYGNNWLAMVFEAQASYTATGVLVKIYAEGTPADDLDVELRDVSGGDPGSTVYASGTLTEADITTDTEGEWYACEFGSSYAVTATTDYAIVLYASAAPDTNNCYHWFYDSSGGYDGMDAYYDASADGGSSWTPDMGKDLMFGMFSAWSSTTWVYPYSSGMNPYYDLTGLSEGMPYRFRVQVYNSYNGAGSPISGDTETLVTLDYILKPTNMTATTVSATEIAVSWIRGTGAQQTRVMYKMGEYPTDHNDGTEGYFGIGSSVNVSGLDPGTTYYFAAWSYAPGSPTNYWSDYEPIDAPTTKYAMDAGSNTTTVVEASLKSTTTDYYVGDTLYNTSRSEDSEVVDYDGGTTTITVSPAISGQTTADEFYLELRCEAMSTTWGGVGEGDYPYSVTGSPNWFLEPSDDAFEFLPGRGVLVAAATSIGLDAGAMFFLLVVLVAVIVGFLLFMFTRNLMIVIVAIGVILIIGLLASAVPGWVFFLYLVIGAPSGYLLSKGAAAV